MISDGSERWEVGGRQEKRELKEGICSFKKNKNKTKTVWYEALK